MQNYLNKFQLFLFDFDGLLVNTELLHYQAYQNLCRARGYELNWDFNYFCRVAHASASGLRHALYADLPGLHDEEPNWDVLYAEKTSAYLKCLQEGKIELMPGVEQMLKALEKENIKRAVVTNSTKAQIDAVRRNLPILETIPVWITREDYSLAKPAPDSYLEAMKRLKGPNDLVVGFEDTLKGLKALQDAKVDHPILICASDHPQLEHVDATVQHFPSFVHLE